MKVRIKSVEDYHGKKRFYPQRKSLFWWVNFERIYHDCAFPIALDSIEEAKEFLDEQLFQEKIEIIEVITKSTS